MKIDLTLICALFISLFIANLGEPVYAEKLPPASAEDGFQLDPNLSGGQIKPETKGKQTFSINNHGSQTNVNINNKSPFVPYIGTGEKPVGNPEDMPPVTDDRKGNLIDKYNLETGVGVKVTPKTKFNFGYRFENTPSIIEGPSGTGSGDRGQFRFSLDIKLPE